MSYTKVLTQRQIELLDFISSQKFIYDNFYLSGGTALAGFILFHRLSEDLDFFTEEEFDIQSIIVLLQKNKKSLKILDIDYQTSYNRNIVFLHFQSEIIKTEFTYYPFPRINGGQKYKNITIDSLEDVTVNKLFTIYQNPRGRDFVDLYLCMKQSNVDIQSLILKAKQKFDWHVDPLQLGSQFEKAHKIKDLPKLLIELDLNLVSEFFNTLSLNLSEDVLKN